MSALVIINCDQQNRYGICAAQAWVHGATTAAQAREAAHAIGWSTGTAQDLCGDCSRRPGALSGTQHLQVPR